MIYLVEEQGADLTRCQAFYEISPSAQNWMNQIYEAIPLHYHPRFQVTIQQSASSTEITLDFSLQEARKLAQSSKLFRDQWTSDHDKNDNFLLPLLDNIDPVVFQSVIDVVIGRVINIPTSPEHLASLVATVNSLKMNDSSVATLRLISYDNLITYLKSNSLLPEELQKIAQLHKLQKQLAQETSFGMAQLLILQEIQALQQELQAQPVPEPGTHIPPKLSAMDRWENLQNYQNILIEITPHAESDETARPLLEVIYQINHHLGSSNRLFNTEAKQTIADVIAHAI